MLPGPAGPLNCGIGTFSAAELEKAGRAPRTETRAADRPACRQEEQEGACLNAALQRLRCLYLRPDCTTYLKAGWGPSPPCSALIDPTTLRLRSGRTCDDV
ncbi:unnamed protein product [Lota lota]